jgi:hypothetical protein
MGDFIVGLFLGRKEGGKREEGVVEFDLNFEAAVG